MVKKIEPSPQKAVSSLSGKIRDRIQTRIKELAGDPFNSRISMPINPHISIRKEGDPEARYSLVENWRIIYRVNESAETLEILEILKKENFSDLKERLSRVNELRRLFWTELRSLRNDFLFQYPVKDFIDNPNWQKIMCSLNDMWESTLTEEIRRRLFHTPGSLIYDIASHKGIYEVNKLCLFCGLPLKGHQRSYCSERCRNNAKSNRYRRKTKKRMNGL